MRRGWVALLVFLAALVQGYFFSSLGISWLIPNLLLILLLYINLERGFKLSLLMALWGGFWLDVASNTLFGFYLLAFSIFVVIVTLISRSGFEYDHVLTLSAVVFLGVVGINLGKLLLSIGSADGWEGAGGLLLIWCAQAVVTVILARLIKRRLQLNLSVSQPLGARRL